jgi:hypothetical protein
MTSVIKSKVLLRMGATMAVVGALGMASMAAAFHSPQHYSLFGDASYVSPGNASSRAVHLVSDTSPGYGGIDYGVEASTTFASLTTLATDYRLEADDMCVGGSPRFQINIVDPNTGIEKNIFAYFGTDSAGAPCIPGTWANTGDFLETGRLLDTSQLTGGTFYDPYTAALAKYGTWVVTGIQVVDDSAWAALDGEHAVDIDNTAINSTLFTYEVPTATMATQCKNGGWKNYADNQGHTFKNQGDCVSFVATGGKNAGAGN